MAKRSTGATMKPASASQRGSSPVRWATIDVARATSAPVIVEQTSSAKPALANALAVLGSNGNAS